MKKTLHLRTLVLIAFIFFVACWRLFVSQISLPIENFTPIGAMALFGGCYFSSKLKSFIFPLMALFISDLVIMHAFFPKYSTGLLYQGWIWTYVAFAFAVVIGSFIKKVSFKSIFISALGASLVHWVISDFGVWFGGLDFTTGLSFTKDIAGFVKCYVLALPFLKGILLGNLVFSGLMFGLFELAQKHFSVLSKLLFIKA